MKEHLMPTSISENRQKTMLKFFAVFILFTVIFIFSNSIKPPSESAKDSDKIVNVIKPGIATDLNKDSVPIYKKLVKTVRKLAHLLEFCLLGFELLMFTSILSFPNINSSSKSCYFCLLVAVSDESIQIFSGRVCDFLDVLTDLTGGVLGITIGLCLFNLIYVISKKRTHKQK